MNESGKAHGVSRRPSLIGLRGLEMNNRLGVGTKSPSAGGSTAHHRWISAFPCGHEDISAAEVVV
jgi:hypothetical protein